MLEMSENFNILPVVMFMLKGLACKWKQPIFYFVISSTPSADLLKILLFKCIKMCEHIVKDIICDQGSNSQSMVPKLGASVSKPYFMNNYNFVIVFYNPPHLLKNICNSLKKSGFKVWENTIRQQDIVSFYRSDSVLPIRMAPKLIRKRVDLPVYPGKGGKGGHGDNLGDTQFHIASWQIKVNHIVYTIGLSNCQEDVDTFLFHLKCIASVQHNEPLPPISFLFFLDTWSRQVSHSFYATNCDYSRARK